jgi:hypothetical protein
LKYLHSHYDGSRNSEGIAVRWRYSKNATSFISTVITLVLITNSLLVEVDPEKIEQIAVNYSVKKILRYKYTRDRI